MKKIEQIDLERLPKHIAIIMDGNGRWAKAKGLPRTFGHRKGVEIIENILEAAGEIGIGTVTVYAFSQENWKRSTEEVSILMDLLVEFATNKAKKLEASGIRVQVLGDIEAMPEKPRKAINSIIEYTAHCDKMIFNLAINYGSRQEIIRATKNIVTSVNSGEISIDEINEEIFNENLYTAGMDEVDLLIRTSGEQRISNFLLWQLAYSELYYTDVLWPDFKADNLYDAVIDYQNRDRRFGGVK